MHKFDNNIAYFHIPKTGGTSFYTFSKNRFGEGKIIKKELFHEPLSIKKEILGEEFNKLKILTTVRNPHALVVSLYFWSKINNDIRYAHLKEIKHMTFDRYIDWYVDNHLSIDDYLLIDGALPENTHIMKLESIEEDAKRILGMTIELPHNNKTKHKPYLEYYNDNTYNKILDKERWSIDTFYRGDKRWNTENFI